MIGKKKIVSFVVNTCAKVTLREGLYLYIYISVCAHLFIFIVCCFSFFSSSSCVFNVASIFGLSTLDCPLSFLQRLFNINNHLCIVIVPSATVITTDYDLIFD